VSTCSVPSPSNATCSKVALHERVDCGFSDISESECHGRGCCFNLTEPRIRECFRPPVVPPADWQHRIQASQMLFSAAPPPSFNAPNVGNGFLAFKVGQPCFSVVGGKGCSPFQNAANTDSKHLGDGQTHLGGLHMAGVFNGIVAKTVAHRARLPSVFNVQAAAASLSDSSTSSSESAVPQPSTISQLSRRRRTTPSPPGPGPAPPGPAPAYLSLQGAALDIEQAVFLNRSTLTVEGVCDVRVEQRIYAHQVHRSLVS
jgi:hypothetical protein